MKWFVALLLAGLLTACSNSKPDAEQFRFLGEVPFSRDVWAQGNEATRASLVYDFIKQHHERGALTRGEVLENLGEPTTYATQEFFPAYTVAQGENRYVVVFVPKSPDLNSEIVRVELEEYPAI